MFFGFLTWGAKGEAAQPVQGATWAWQGRGRDVRVFPPRVRDEFWVEDGHSENPNPYLDTRDLP